MKRWYDTQIGRPLSHAQAAPSGRINIQAHFAGTGALKLTPSGKVWAEIRMAGTGGASFNARRLLAAVAQFAGGSTLFADLYGKMVPATASFAGSSTCTISKIAQGWQAVAQFAGAGLLQTQNPTVLHRWIALAQFAGGSTLTANMLQHGRIQAVANFAGSSTMNITSVRQRMLAVARFVGASSWLITPRQRMLARASFVGVGSWQTIGNIIPAGGGTPPNAPVLTLASSTSDTTPDFDIDLPSGAANGTEARVGDVLIVQDSPDAGSNWNTYVSHVLVSGDLSGNAVGATATALPSGSYQYRARLERGALYSSWSAVVSGSIVVPPAAPVLTIVSAESDTTPDFDIDIPTGAGDDSDAAVGDLLIVQTLISGPGTTWQPYLSHTIVSGDLSGSGFSASAAPLVAGTYLARARLERSSVPSPWSANVVFVIRVGSTVPANIHTRSQANKGEASATAGRLRAQIDKG